MQSQDRVIEGFRLSPQQKRLWGLQSDNSVYRVQGTVRIEGELSSAILKSALQQIVDRHEILRTHFVRPGGLKTPIQVIAERSQLMWCEIDLQEWSAQQQQTQIDLLFKQEQHPSFDGEHSNCANVSGCPYPLAPFPNLGEKEPDLLLPSPKLGEGLGVRAERPCYTIGMLPFDVEHDSQLRSTLFRLSAQEHILLLSVSALCADARTLKNLVQEINQSYQACLRGEELDDEVVQYTQFSEWQHQLLEDESAQTGEAYWLQQDMSALARLKLPFETKFDHSTAFDVRSLEWQVVPETIAAINALTQQHNTTPATFFLACWFILLWRFTQQRDMIVGTAYDGRNDEDLKPAIGLFAKYLPLWCYLNEQDSLTQLLQSIDQAVHNNLQWQDYFNWEQFETQAESELGVASFPFCFDFDEQTAQHSSSGVVFTLDRQYSYIDRFKLKLSCIQTAETLVTQFHYDVNLFNSDDIQRLVEHWQALIDGVLANPQKAISQLPILSDRQRHQLLVEFNNTQTPVSKFCLHERFESQVDRVPNNIAVIFEDQQLSYAELNTRADKLAHDLQILGVKPEVRVGIYLERSCDLIIAILAVLKAGGAYLPLDPAFPRERLAFMIEDAQVSVLLTQTSLLKLIPEVTAQVICLDDRNPSSVSHTTSLLHSPSSSNLAYIIYTSGSTGQPKGVAVEHQQICNYVQGILERLNLPEASSFATVSTIAADLGNTALFSALCTGGCLHIISADRAATPQAFAEYCRQHPIDCLKIVPSHLEALITSGNADILPRQRLILGGEACTWRLIEIIQQLAPNCVVVNHYGPTETTIGVLTYQVQNLPAHTRMQTVFLGRPIANTQIYVLDQQLQPVPIGVPGELCIGGDNVARGYLNRPKLTAERFIQDPFNKDENARLYKTGDLVRYQADGNLEFLGRIDDQVKIRGFRVELGEIEAVLCQHPDIQQAIVLLHADEVSNPRLIAYVVSQAKGASTAHEWRNFLKEQVPDYMLPSAFVRLKTVPLTPNGKVDKQALPIPDTLKSDQETIFVPPREALELQLTQIWEDLLNVRPISVTDNFFDLGGHSLLAVRLIAQVEKQFQQKLLLSTFLQGATIEHLAGILRQQPQAWERSPLVKIQPHGTNPPLFFIHPIGGNVICYYNLANHLGSDQPFYALEAPGLYGECQPLECIEDLAGHYIKALQTVQPHGPYYLGGWSMGGIVAFEIAQQLQQQGESIALLALLDSTPPLSNISPTDSTFLDDAKLLADLAESTAHFFGQQLSISPTELKPLEPNQQLNYVLDVMKAAHFVPPDIQPNQIRAFLQVYKSNTRALMQYVPKPYSSSITFFRSSQPFLDDQKTSEMISDPVSSWTQLSAHPIDVRIIPGDHTTMLAEPNIRVLAEQIKDCLKRTP
jgi:amino acid adenylation domain-containing protein